MYKITYIALFMLLFSCGEDPEPEVIEPNWTKENSTELGREIAIQEEIDIKLFLELHKDWKMQKTGSGLLYYIYEVGEEDTTYHPKPGDVAEIEHTITLLDGTVCYETPSDEYVELLVDNSDVESGLQEGIKHMTVGDRAKLIVPSHLGHGLVGDMDKIPPLNTLVIDIHLLGIIVK